MPRLACILPVLDRTADMEPTLVSLLENRPRDTEILVVLTTPYNDPYNLADEVRFVQAPARSTWLQAVNQALPLVQSPYVHTLSLGLTVNEGWADRALHCFDDPQVAAVAIPVQNGQQEFLGWDYQPTHGAWRVTVEQQPAETATIKLSQQDSPAIMAPAWQAGCYRMMALELLGGKFPVACGPTLSDLDLGLMLHYIGYDAAISSGSIQASDPLLYTELKTGFQQGRADEQLFGRNVAHASWFELTVRHPLQILGEVATGLVQPSKLLHAIGRLTACFDWGKWKQHRASLEDSRRACQSMLHQLLELQLRIDRAHDTQRILQPQVVRSERTTQRKAA